MCGETRIDKIRDKEIRGRIGVQGDLSGSVEKYVQRWFGHVERMAKTLFGILNMVNDSGV